MNSIGDESAFRSEPIGAKPPVNMVTTCTAKHDPKATLVKYKKSRQKGAE